MTSHIKAPIGTKVNKPETKSMTVYVYKNGRFEDKATGEPMVLDPRAIVSSPMFMKDSPGVVDPIEGKWLEGRSARREFMKRHDVIETGDVKPLNDGYARTEKFARAHGLKYQGDR